MKLFHSLALVSALVVFQHAQVVQAEEPAISSFKAFKNYGEAVAFYRDKGQLPHPTGKVYSGYSLEPFGSRSKALAEAQENAVKAGVTTVIITQDFKRNYDTPPPGSKWYGTFNVISMEAIVPVDATPENLLAEIQKNPAVTTYYFDLAKKPEFKGLTKGYREIIRTKNDENASGLPLLIQLIVLHDGKSCGDDLLRWAKYHKNANARLAAYLGLIEFGRTAEVEEALKSEPNNEVKVKVQKSLI
jgi:hypothetical protein